METHFANPQFYRHVDGGLYRAYTQALHTEDLGAHMVYEHVWPFPVTPCVRPLKAFQARFTLISNEEAHALMAGDRVAAQEAIRASKTARQSREGKVGKRSSLYLRTGQSAQDELYKLANFMIAEGEGYPCRVTLNVSTEADHDRLAVTASELAAMGPEELGKYDLITLNASSGDLTKPWCYTYDPANMAGAFVYL
jgi:hypothetical protein